MPDDPSPAAITTQVTDLLDRLGISYRVLPHSEPVFTVETAAAQRGVIKEEMVKSILLRDENRRYVMACVTGDARLDPKAVRAYLGGEWKRLSFANAEEILTVTEYVQGAVTPLCMPDDVPVIFDEGIARCAKVNISSGDPMAGLELATQDLIRAARARLAKIALIS
ncbi:MAG: YbaK/EbsC family protein [Chloroflexi bacterium]|nr:YbaK/EbsC family protein [Chloroflexota bacterium]